MLKLNFLEKVLGIVSPPHFADGFSRKMFLIYIVLTDQISQSDCLNFFRYWAICVFQLFISQAVTSETLKLTLSF